MASSFVGFCDALIEELAVNVSGLRGVYWHRYAPWDPEVLVAENGERHCAVFPAAEAAEESQPLVTGPGGDQLLQLYRVLYWESAQDEPSRGVADEDAASDLLGLLEAVRARFYDRDNTFLGGVEHLAYVGASLPDRSGTVRWFQLSIRIRTSLVAT